MSYINRIVQEYIFLILKQVTRNRWRISRNDFAPRFSPDGDKIVMSYTDPDIGNSEIYVLDLKTRISSRITNNSAIDVSARFFTKWKKYCF